VTLPTAADCLRQRALHRVVIALVDHGGECVPSNPGARDRLRFRARFTV
jgi:hypothetical protein